MLKTDQETEEGKSSESESFAEFALCDCSAVCIRSRRHPSQPRRGVFGALFDISPASIIPVVEGSPKHDNQIRKTKDESYTS